MTVGVLLLAAGSARRFGSDKRRAQLADGRTLLAASVDAAARSGLPLRVCLAPGDADLAEQLAHRGVAVFFCPGAAGGMGHTLADAVRQRPGDWSGIVVALADMPWVEPASYRAIADLLTPDTVVVPCCDGRRGNPVGFGSRFFTRLAQCAGDRGARDILRESATAVRELSLDDPGIHRDVDTVDALSPT